MSPRALTCMGTAPLQPRPDELTGPLASSCDTARHASQKARCPSVEAALVIALRLTCVVTRTEMFGDDLVQELCHASIGVARRLLEARFRRGRNPPRIHFSLPGHALQCSAITGVNQSRLSLYSDGRELESSSDQTPQFHDYHLMRSCEAHRGPRCFITCICGARHSRICVGETSPHGAENLS